VQVKEPIFAGLDYDPEESAPKRKRRKKEKVETQAPPPEDDDEDVGHGSGLAPTIHDHGALLDDTPLEPSAIARSLSPESRKILNNSRKQRGMLEAEELGQVLFSKLPDNYQRRITDLIRIMDNISTGHPKLRSKMVRTIVESFLQTVRDSRRRIE
jgi:hypothetical protein